jgi:hypothetical protein
MRLGIINLAPLTGVRIAPKAHCTTQQQQQQLQQQQQQQQLAAPEPEPKPKPKLAPPAPLQQQVAAGQ